ncbi:beta-xylosidase [Haloferula helveola]|uniref:Beta-xylosidase n=1 Tax=Haloferula helveola TaxID=490095 RepID=A0ABM7R9E4_9BACT|nr:beta-xylosidase [Haloferula helveola]
MNRWTLLLAALGLVPTLLQAEPGPFGIGSCHINGRSVDDYERWVPEMREIGIGYQRSLMTHWGAVEPEPGKWNWENVDAQWKYLHDLGFETGTLLIGTPSWNKKDPPGHLPVNHIEGWKEYVRQTVTHFRGKVSRFEVWNEPPNFTGPNQTPADYAKLVVAAYDAAKEANPDCEIGLTAKSAHIHYLKQVIRAGAADHFDWISLHPYEVLDGIVEDAGMECAYLNIVPTVRRMLVAENPAKRDVPITFTELGVDAVRHGEKAQAAALVKAYVMGIAQGVENIQWFEGRDGDSGPMGLLDRDGKPRMAYRAYSRMIKELGPNPEPMGWLQVGETGLGFAFKVNGQPVVVAWVPRKESETVTLPDGCRSVGLVDRSEATSGELRLDGLPVALHGLPSSWIGKVRQIRGGLPPWPGDPGSYADAKSVSIDFSRKPAEQGLHRRSGERLAEAIVAYGGSARAGDAPGGNLFTVDPAFLCYDPEPIRITAEVRRKDPAVNAGFKLVYEGGKDFKTAGGWFTVPPEDGWHTATWTIEDPGFVSYWGYHFRIESDGPKFSQYYLRRIVVEKLDGASR